MQYRKWLMVKNGIKDGRRRCIQVFNTFMQQADKVRQSTTNSTSSPPSGRGHRQAQTSSCSSLCQDFTISYSCVVKPPLIELNMRSVSV